MAEHAAGCFCLDSSAEVASFCSFQNKGCSWLNSMCAAKSYSCYKLQALHTSLLYAVCWPLVMILLLGLTPQPYRSNTIGPCPALASPICPGEALGTMGQLKQAVSCVRAATFWCNNAVVLVGMLLY